MATKPKPVSLITIDPFKHEDRHYAIGDVLTDVDYEQAMNLTGAGRTRLATADELAAATKKTKKAAD